MISATDANKLRSGIDKALLNIGKTNGTKLPQSKSNSGQAALQYWLATMVVRFANNMMKKATADAIKEGVIFDHKKHPLPAGVNKMFYQSDVVNVVIETRAASTRVDLDKLRTKLREAKVKDTVIDEAFAGATVSNAPPHLFHATLVEETD